MKIENFIGKAGMQHPQNKFRLKKVPEIKHFIAPQMQNISYSRGHANSKNILMNLD